MSDQQQHSLYQSQNAASSAGSVNSSSATLGSGGLRSGGSIQGGRRPIIIRDDQQRVMLQSIRDSLAHLQKASPHSPGSDASGASGTSTPNKDSAQSKEGQAVAAASAKRSDTYNSAAMAKIKKSLQTFKKEDARDSVEVEATAKVNVRELIDQINPENRNGDLKSRLGGLVPTLPPNTIHSTSVRKVIVQLYVTAATATTATV
ncbi:hypothetical protein EB796_007805 [Bugula neritina]|uniref:Uncharacterized protein n=1 Tax=Bugula neritina TaxID=10212 RepID=A0A7J7K6P3_BUGNE|nr:hypothetical protein EB796_007805 [Bugula neritina]